MKSEDTPGSRLITAWHHEMRPVVPATSSLRPNLRCLHFTDQHTGEETNTWDWVNTLHARAFKKLLQVLMVTDIDTAVLEIDRRVLRTHVAVEYVVDEFLAGSV